ncbi:MAG: flagellar export protein FliJ [Bacillota bacterium]|jgi:flagellar FliJ protein|nr:FliJ family protein [Clostridia bacterium]
MGFKFRMEVNLKLAKHELNRCWELLAREINKLRQMEEVYQREEEIARMALRQQERACRSEPENLAWWHAFINYQKQKLEEILLEIKKQEEIVRSHREELIKCKIKTEKFQRLKAKRWREYCAEQLRQEQIVIDEIAQNSKVRYF